MQNSSIKNIEKSFLCLWNILNIRVFFSLKSCIWTWNQSMWKQWVRLYFRCHCYSQA